MDAAAASLGLGGDDDADDGDDEAMAPAAPAKPKKDKPKKKKKKKSSSSSKTGADVLAGIFGAKAAATIVKKADRAVAARAAAPPAPPKFDGIVRKATAVETKRFGGQTVEVRKTVRETAKATKQRARAHGDRLDRVLDAIAGKKELTAVAKSSAEWDLYKEKEGLEDSLKDAGQKGYLAKQAFMERADQRKFAIERDHRNAERAKRDQQ